MVYNARKLSISIRGASQDAVHSTAIRLGPKKKRAIGIAGKMKKQAVLNELEQSLLLARQCRDVAQPSEHDTLREAWLI